MIVSQTLLTRQNEPNTPQSCSSGKMRLVMWRAAFSASRQRQCSLLLVPLGSIAERQAGLMEPDMFMNFHAFPPGTILPAPLSLAPMITCWSALPS